MKVYFTTYLGTVLQAVLFLVVFGWCYLFIEKLKNSPVAELVDRLLVEKAYSPCSGVDSLAYRQLR